MSRLIDAGQTKLMLSELLEVAKKENFTVEDTIEHACVWVDNLPTAYDVEKVVEEFEEKSIMVATSKEFYNNPKNGEYVEEVVALKTAIDIVRKGGIK